MYAKQVMHSDVDSHLSYIALITTVSFQFRIHSSPSYDCFLWQPSVIPRYSPSGNKSYTHNLKFSFSQLTQYITDTMEHIVTL